MHFVRRPPQEDHSRQDDAGAGLGGSLETAEGPAYVSASNIRLERGTISRRTGRTVKARPCACDGRRRAR